METAYAETVLDLIERLKRIQGEWPDNYPLRWFASNNGGINVCVVYGQSCQPVLKVMPGLRPEKE